MKIIYGVRFSVGKDGGMAALCAVLAVLAALVAGFITLEGRAEWRIYALLAALAALALTLCSVVILLLKRRKRWN